MGSSIMAAIRARTYDMPVFAHPPDPTLGGLTPGVYPGTVGDPARGGPNRFPSFGAGGGTAPAGTTALVILGVVVLALVGFNVSTRAFQA